jgi:hypothetical protein
MRPSYYLRTLEPQLLVCPRCDQSEPHDPDRLPVWPIAEHDSPPTCERCLEQIEDVALTRHGWLRALEHAEDRRTFEDALHVCRKFEDTPQWRDRVRAACLARHDRLIERALSGAR